MDNIIIIFVLVLMIGTASCYIWKERKKGIKCIGCPNAKYGSCKGSGCQSGNSGTCSDKTN